VGGKKIAAGKGVADELVIDYAEEADEEEVVDAPDPAADTVLVGANVVSAGADRDAGTRVPARVEVQFESSWASGESRKIEVKAV